MRPAVAPAHGPVWPGLGGPAGDGAAGAALVDGGHRSRIVGGSLGRDPSTDDTAGAPAAPTGRRQPSTTYSSRGASLSTIGPSGPHTTMSSMRAPYSPDEVDAGLDGERHPGAQRHRRCRRRCTGPRGPRGRCRGRSDGRTPRRSPPPSMTSRAAPSIDSQATPGRTARVAAAWAACSTPKRWRNRSSGPVRRVAAGHPQRPRDVRAVAAERAADVEDDRLAGLDDPLRRLVVRRRRVRAGADDRERGRARGPRRRSRSRTSRATSASVRPTSRPAAIWATTRSAACAARRSSAISSASLIIRSSRRTAVASSKRRAWAARAGAASRWHRPAARSETREPARAGADAAVDERRRRARAGRRSRPRSTISTAVRQARSAAPRLEPRDDDERVVRRARDEHRQPLERHRLVAGEVPEVRPDPDEQRVEAVRRRRVGGPRRRSRIASRIAGRPAASATSVTGDAEPGRERRAARPRTACGRRRRAPRRRRARACAAPGRRAGPTARTRGAGGTRAARSPRRGRRRAPSGRRSRASAHSSARSSSGAVLARDRRRRRRPGRRRASRVLPDEVLGEDGDRGSVSRTPARGGGRRRAPMTTPVGPPSSTIGMWRNPPTAILWIATAIGSSWRSDDRVRRHDVARSCDASSGLPATFTTASRSVKMPTSSPPVTTSRQSTPVGVHPLDGGLDGRVRRRSGRGAGAPEVVEVLAEQPAVERRGGLRRVGADRSAPQLSQTLGPRQVAECRRPGRSSSHPPPCYSTVQVSPPLSTARGRPGRSARPPPRAGPSISWSWVGRLDRPEHADRDREVRPRHAARA